MYDVLCYMCGYGNCIPLRTTVSLQFSFFFLRRGFQSNIIVIYGVDMYKLNCMMINIQVNRELEVVKPQGLVVNQILFLMLRQIIKVE